MKCNLPIVILSIFLTFILGRSGPAQEIEIEIVNKSGFALQEVYFVADIQTATGTIGDQCLMADKQTGATIYTQIFNRRVHDQSGLENFSIIAPVDLKAGEGRIFILKPVSDPVEFPDTDLSIAGEDLDLTIENSYYRADLRINENEDGQKYMSGQLNRLELKSRGDVVFKRKSNRMHWAPNFRRRHDENYTTVAHWDPPDSVVLDKGPYLVRLMRMGRAPGIPELQLITVYHFLAGKPYFLFYSEMAFQKDVILSLLRNDEMTMDSLFTHVAFGRTDGRLEDYNFGMREAALISHPIGNSDPWLCFYHETAGYAFGSIRILYDILNEQGSPSPTFLPHTRISDGAGGGKYWNRRLIHEKDTFVPAGSRYREENAYLVFEIGEEGRLKEILYWQERLKNPPEVKVMYPDVSAY